ncbi:5-oxoprolinase subunit B family protein [Pseudogemmobacter bohemicus]|uniref:5-oxoprolinase subunit B family protein n=1 Tax=Pseudogemmobacter bohemicus TaxID=2250708 RepID=UPI000DD42F7A|nr:allophanate hydrolase subunit 1 [Pseudogemmobacter bohemicus]
MAAPRFRPVAEHGLLVEFGEGVDTGLHRQVMALDAALNAAPPPAMIETVPGNACLLVRFDCLATDHAGMEAAIRQHLGRGASELPAGRLREIAVCYDAPFAPDLETVAAKTGQSREAVISTHLLGEYEVFLYGFAPGYAYLTGVPETIRLPRKSAAIRDIPAGSVLIAASQCIVSTLKMPTGWWVIGRSPTRVLTADSDRPFLFDPGDRVRFRRIRHDDPEMRHV